MSKPTVSTHPAQLKTAVGKDRFFDFAQNDGGRRRVSGGGLDRPFLTAQECRNRPSQPADAFN